MSGGGVFVVLEGGEGSGKSTQVARLARRLREHGHDVVETFEPGGTALGARVRDVFLHDSRAIDARAELFLVAADRAQHVEELIAPALARNAIVVCDRFSPSTLAYQGRARGLPLPVVAEVCRLAEGDIEPDVVVVLDVNDEVAAKRAPRDPDRLERAGEDFHALVRRAYRELAPKHRWVVVDANGDVDDVAGKVWSAVEPHLA